MKRLLSFFLALTILLSLTRVGWADDILDQQTSEDGYYDELCPSGCDDTNFGQAVTGTSSGKKITKITLILRRVGSPGGTGVVKIYNCTGTPGTNGTADGGAAIATSDAINLNDISTSKGPKDLTFSGANQITLPSTYVWTFEPSAGDSSNRIWIYYNSTSVAADQNMARNRSGWGYSATLDTYFILYGVTAAVVPTVTTGAISSITKTTASSSVTVDDDGGATPTATGICWSTSANPTTADSKTTGGSGSITGLTAGTTYHVRAYATNTAGTGYGSDISWVAAQDYLVAQGGTAANKGAAVKTGSPSYPTGYMSPETHNGQTFNPGDTIYISSAGGTLLGYAATFHTEAAQYCLVAPSTGTSAGKITYKNVTGESPTIDNTIDLGTTVSTAAWTSMGGGVYRADAVSKGEVFFEDDVPLVAGTDETLAGSVNWWCTGSGGYFYWKPSNGVLAGHTVKILHFVNADWEPPGLDIEEKSYIEVSGLNFVRCGLNHGNNKNTAVPPAVLSNISIHDCTFTQAMWGIWGQVSHDTIEQDVEIYNNTFNYCNGGISTWATDSDTSPTKTQRPLRHNVHHNTINNLYSITPALNWSYGLLAYSIWTDHEGISFQSAMDCTIADNIITTNNSAAFTGAAWTWTRGIYLYMAGGASKTSGNSILRNKVIGRYTQAIYLSGDVTPGFENNTIAKNALVCTSTATDHAAIQARFDEDNPSTTANYIYNNTIDYAYTGGDWSINLDASHLPGNWTIKNNIIKARLLIHKDATGTYDIDYNAYYASYSDPFNQAGTQDWTSWKALGFDANGVFGSDPKLRITDGSITTLTPSTITTGGTKISGITYSGAVGLADIIGNLYTVDNPAMGAYAEAGYPLGGGGVGLGMGINSQMPPWMRR